MTRRPGVTGSFLRPSRETGLTLIELAVVMAVIAILMGAGFLGLLSWLT
ncbi:MAG: type II secretion system protein [Acidiferrobacter sp.]